MEHIISYFHRIISKPFQINPVPHSAFFCRGNSYLQEDPGMQGAVPEEGEDRSSAITLWVCFFNLSFYSCFKNRETDVYQEVTPWSTVLQGTGDFKNCNLFLGLTSCLCDLLHLANSSWIAL